MRIVIYDDETMEPITVVDVRGLTERHIDDLGGRPLFLPIKHQTNFMDATPRSMKRPYIVTIWFEKFVRNDMVTHMCFTNQAELAMLLGPSFLPGQQRRINEMQDHIRGLTKLCEMLETALGL